MFALQGQAFGCVADACHQALKNCHVLELDDQAQSHSCCEAESPEAQPACCNDADACETNCELGTHTHQLILVFEAGKRSLVETLALLSVFSELYVAHLPKATTLQPAQGQAQPSSPLLVSYCVWRL